jgi:hypothetical protein
MDVTPSNLHTAAITNWMLHERKTSPVWGANKRLIGQSESISKNEKRLVHCKPHHLMQPVNHSTNHSMHVVNMHIVGGGTAWT